MRRFILQENIRRWEAALEHAGPGENLAVLNGILETSRRELALLDALENGVLPPWQRRPVADDAPLIAAAVAAFRSRYEASPQVAALIDPRPGLVFRDVNPAYVRSGRRSREDLVGRAFFDMFPDRPNSPSAQGIVTSYEALRDAAERQQVVCKGVHRYDLPAPDGGLVERYWRNVVRPLPEAADPLSFLVLEVNDVTDAVLGGGVARALKG